MGSIVDLRSNAWQPLKNLFDLLLGFTSVWCTDDCLRDWRSLVERVSAANAAADAARAGCRWRAACGWRMGSWPGNACPARGLSNFIAKRVPLAGANSNVNLNSCWSAKYAGDPVLDYLRVAPTGPMTPLVFSTTTLGKGLSIGLTYRGAIISPERAGAIGEGFVQAAE